MSGSKESGAKTRETIYKKFGEDFYSKIGSIGAEEYKKRQAEGVAKPRGFALNPELAIRAGKIGGSKSKRGPA